MPQSLAKIYIHAVFSTKGRERLIPDDLRPRLYAYMGGILRDLGCPSVEINTEPDHGHVLFLLSRTRAVADVVGELKKGSTNWLHEQRQALKDFHWQSGYGAFSVSRSHFPSVRKYIRNQREHHRRRSFQDEFRALLKRYGIEYDERYVWD